NLWKMRLFGEFQSTCNGSRIVAQELKVQCAKLKIRCGDVTHQGVDYRLVRPVSGQQVGTCCLGCATILAPKVQLPQQRSADGIRTCFIRLVDRLLVRDTLVDGTSAGPDRGQLVGPRDSQLCLRLQNPCGRDAYVVVVLKCGANQSLQLRILKNIPPLFVTERLPSRHGCWLCCAASRRRLLQGGILRLRRFQRRRSAIRVRNINLWSPVVGPNCTSRSEKNRE